MENFMNFKRKKSYHMFAKFNCLSHIFYRLSNLYIFYVIDKDEYWSFFM